MRNTKNKWENGEKLQNPSQNHAKSKKATSMRRPSTHPELLDRAKPAMERTPWLNLEIPPHFPVKHISSESASTKTSATKLLVNVTVAQSIGPLRVLISTEATVLDVIKAALELYAKEGRKPILGSNPLSFGLHYSLFTIDSLNRNDKIKDLGSRNYFMCPENKEVCAESGKSCEKSNNITCGSEMHKPWCRLLMDYFLSLH